MKLARLPCWRCEGALQSRQVGARDRFMTVCTECNAAISQQREHHYRCISSECVLIACGTCYTRCARSRQAVAQAAGAPAAALDVVNAADAAGIAPPAVAVAEPCIPDELRKLRMLPGAFPRAPVMWVPRDSGIADTVLTGLLDDATVHLAATEGDIAAAVALRRCLAGPQLLFRASRHRADKEDLEGRPPTPGSTAGDIKQRLRQAVRGEWEQLVDDLLADLREDPGPPAQSMQPAEREPEELDMATLAAAAVKGANGSPRGCADILVGGPPVPPGPETDEKVRALFMSDRRQPIAEQALREGIAKADALPDRRRVRITPRRASQRCSALKAPAGPGPSGWRNSHILVLHRNPQGPRILAQWASAWGCGRVSAWVAELWTPALAKPFWKPDLVSVRPIIQSEALLKFAIGSIVDTVRDDIARGCGTRQFAGR